MFRLLPRLSWKAGRGRADINGTQTEKTTAVPDKCSFRVKEAINRMGPAVKEINLFLEVLAQGYKRITWKCPQPNKKVLGSVEFTLSTRREGQLWASDLAASFKGSEHIFKIKCLVFTEALRATCSNWRSLRNGKK